MNIEEAAKAAGILPERDETFGKVYEVELQQLAAFAKIIRNQALEDAANLFFSQDRFSAAGIIRAMKEQT